MSQSLAQNFIHLIFSTKDRQPLITEAVQGRLYPYLAKAFAGQESPAVKIGGVADHVHVLSDGKIIQSGDKDLALELEQKGYAWLT